MNKRLEELAEQHGFIHQYMSPGERRDALRTLEKFAEAAQKWWSIPCSSNRHLETTRKAHDDFCALQAAIRARGESK